MQRIEKRIHMGMGEQTLAQMGHLYTQLGRAFEILNDIQQPPTCHESKEACELHEQDGEDGDYELECIAKEIFIALTGKKSKVAV